MNIYIEKETEINPDFDYEELICRVIRYAIDFEKCPYETEVNVVLTDNDSICKINKEYREINRPTDVLSFPMIVYEKPGYFEGIDEHDDYFHPETGELLLGDIMISLEKVKEQAMEYNHSQQRELGFLVAHSMLHLFGYDHINTEDAQEMEQRQKTIMDNLKIFR